MRLGIGHVVDQSDPRRAGDHLARKLQLLCRQTFHVRRYPSHIAGRPGFARSEAERNRIGTRTDNNRNRGSGFSGGNGFESSPR